MGVPDDDCPVVPVRKRLRLSLKNTKQKVEALSKTSEDSIVETPDQSLKDESMSDVEEKPLSSESTSAESIASPEKDGRVPAVASLENFGNTCFMNSILQVLRYTPGFLDNLAQLFQDILASEKIKRKNKNNIETDDEVCGFEEDNCKKCWKVVRNVYRVYRDLSLLEEKYEEVASDDVMSMAVKPSRILTSVRDLNPMFEGNLQHDAQEFLRCLLCYLQDAEKEVQKFYTQLPPRLSPRAVVLNPIMRQFLKAAKKAGKSQSESTAHSGVDDVAKINMKNDEVLKSDIVKVNLFPKDDAEEKTEAARSPSKILVGPNLGDTASIVDKKSTTEIQSGAVPKSSKSLESNLGDETEKGSKTRGGPTRSRGMARRGRKFTPYRSVQERKSEEVKSNERNGKVRKGSKDISPSDKSQPCISDIFNLKTYSAKKRLGMSSAIVKKTSEDLFDEMKNSSGDKHSSSPRKSQSLPYLNRNSESKELQPFVSLTDVHSRVSPDDKVDTKQCDSNANAKFENNDDNLSKTSSCDIEDMDVDKQPASSAKANAVDRSFQDIFAQFLQGTKMFDSDSDSVDVLSESDNEDIVMQKKVAKHIHESPRRSPRKIPEMFSSSAKKSQSLPVQTEQTDSAIPRKILCFDSKNKLSWTRSNPLANSPVKSASEANTSNVKPETIGEVFNDMVKLEEGTQKLDKYIDSTIVEMKDRNLLPIIKLEKCDHVFDNSDSKSVSANYAAKCLTPQKNSPKKTDLDDSSNYLKCRNLLADFHIKDENDLQKALEEMYDSPVKSRSKCDLIERLFEGSMILRTRCLQCESSKERREDFHDVSVPVRLEHSESDDEEDGETDSRCGLMKLIEASTEVEKLLEDNKYFCEECKCYVEAERSMLYDVMPDILTLHLKRFCATSGKYSSITKINDEVEIPFTLPCLRYRCPKVCLRPDHRYSLYAVVTHSGVTLTAGHYLAYVRALPNPAEVSSESIENAANAKEDSDQPISNCKVSEEVSKTSSEKGGKKMPATRRKMGIVSKMPGRFEDCLTNTRVKGIKDASKSKAKPRLADCLVPSKRFNTEWFECDDETVRVFGEEDFKDIVDGRCGAMLGTPYLLFYHKATLV